MNGQALPAPWIWWDTFGLPAVSTTPHDVNAGPIFSNQQAQPVCPGVCTQAHANWNGQWKTTVPSQMSAVACPRARSPPAAGSWTSPASTWSTATSWATRTAA